MLEHHNKNRKRPFSDPVHKYLEELSYYKQAKPEPKPEITPANSGAASTSKPELEGFEDLEKEITPFGKFGLYENCYLKQFQLHGSQYFMVRCGVFNCKINFVGYQV